MLTFALLLPNRKWLGVKVLMSFTRSLIGASGLPLMIGSISVKYVSNITSVNNESRTTVFSAFFVILTIASIDPFIHGEAGWLKFHLISLLEGLWKLLWSSSENVSRSSFSSPIKFVPSTLKMYTGYSYREINLPKPIIKLSVDKFPKSSKRAARVVKRVKAVL